jgi:hypothetical protein
LKELHTSVIPRRYELSIATADLNWEERIATDLPWPGVLFEDNRYG